MLRTYIIPRIFYGLQSPRIEAKRLSECDRLIRRCAKKILHLHATIGSQMLHARPRDGGLGLADLRHKIPTILRDRLNRLTENPILAPVLLASEMVARVHRLSRHGDADAFWRE